MTSNSNELLFLAPVNKQTIWGGNSLAAAYGFAAPGEPIAEAWAVSAHPAGDCTVIGGAFDGCTLSQLWAQHPELFACPGIAQYPLLTKFIDAASDLSVQVHPDDAYAAANEAPVNGEPCRGKSECWYILQADPGAKLVLGHTAASAAQAKELIRAGRWDDLLCSVPIKAGDFFRIDPGTVHAIGGGIRLLEVQQSSDITYRLYDYDRLQNGVPRPLHLDKALAVMTVPAAPVSEKPSPLPLALAAGTGSLTLLEQCSYFTVRHLALDGSAAVPNTDTFTAVSVIDGEGAVNGVPVKKGQSFIAPHGVSELRWQGCCQAILAAPVI